MQERDVWVDYAKALGIVLVVFGHVARGLHDAGIPVNEPLFTLVDSVVYSFHMPLFFFLSGLFFYNSFGKRGALGLVGSKVDTIVYPYIVWSILQGLTEAFLSTYTNGNVSYSEVFTTLLWSPRAQFWFLYALFVVFVVATLVFSLLSRRAAAIALTASVLTYIYQSSLPDNFVVGYLAHNMVFLAFGMLFTSWAIPRHLGSNLVLSSTALSFVASQYVFHQSLGLTHSDKGAASLLLSLVSILFVVSLSVRLSRSPRKWLLLVGSSSMGIYLMHLFAGSGTRVILKRVLDVDSYAIHLSFGCFLGLFAPLVAVQLIKHFKIPFVFSAPVSTLVRVSCDKALQWTRR